MQKKAVLSLGIAGAIALGAYWYWSPYIALREIQSALRNADPDEFNAHVDYPKLRESLKGQLSAVLMNEAASSSGSSAERIGASLGGMFGLALVDRMVDAFVRPEAVMHAMQAGKFKLGKQSPPASVDAALNEDDSPQWHTDRKNKDLIIVYAGPEDAPATEKAGFVMTREGFSQWKLTEVRLPALNR